MPAVVASEPVAEPVKAPLESSNLHFEDLERRECLSRASLRWSGAALRGAVQAVEKCSGNRAASGVKDFLQMHENRALGPRRTSHHFLLHVLSREEDGCAGCGSGFGPFVFADAAAVLMLVQALAVDQLFGFAGAAAVLMLA
eukprot:g4548.t2